MVLLACSICELNILYTKDIICILFILSDGKNTKQHKQWFLALLLLYCYDLSFVNHHQKIAPRNALEGL